MDKDNIAKEKNESKASSWAEWFDRSAQAYDDPRMKMAYYEDGKTGKPVSPEVMKAMYEDIWNKLSANSSLNILDVGGGIGMFSKAFGQRVKKIIGTDISVTMLQDAAKLNPQGTYIVCDAAFLPFKENSFDRILCYSVFHYLSDLDQVRRVLAEFLRIARKDGLVFIGDILKPQEAQVSAPSVEKKSNKDSLSEGWWPTTLNHNLMKLMITPAFFLGYCRQHGLQCSVLGQNIIEKNTTSSRYDVTIKLSNAE